MNIFIRCDSSANIGIGHVVRCLTLARYLRNEGAEISFICKSPIGNIIDFIEKESFKVYKIPGTIIDWETDLYHTMMILKAEKRVDWLIIDHYYLGIEWEKEMRDFTNHMMVIDDFAQKNHDCDLLLNYHLDCTLERKYQDLLPPYATRFIGPKYLLINEEFFNAKKEINRSYDRLNRVLVSFGGADPTNETLKTLQAIKNIPEFSNIKFYVILGKSSTVRKEVVNFSEKMSNVTLYNHIEDMASFIIHADLAIGSGGVSSYERCLLGLPAITIQTADNQTTLIHSMKQLGLIYYLGTSANVNHQVIQSAIKRFIYKPELRECMSKKCLASFPDQSGISLITNKIMRRNGYS